MDTMNDTKTSRDSLWMLTIAPTIWAIHFLASYVTASVWCEKYVASDGALGGVRTAIGIYTVVALIAIATTGWIGYRWHNFAAGRLPHNADTPEDRHRFLGFAVLLLSGLSAVATLFVSAVAVFIGNCD